MSSRFTQALVAHLRSKRNLVIEHTDVLEQRHDPTYGEQPPGTTTISTVDFEALLDAIDEFAASFE
jgi:hypothetical protein